MNNEQMQVVPVERDDGGWWTHPAFPDLGEDGPYTDWFATQGLETTYEKLEWYPEHPLYDPWFEDGVCDCSSWTPSAPSGEGWFTISIHDTEDGPIWWWARKAEVNVNQSGDGALGEKGADRA